MRRILDFIVSLTGLLVFGPVILVFAFLIWLQDKSSPLYLAVRAGRDAKPFRMVKLRSMVANADRIGGDSTAGDDMRITPIGTLVRRYKLDELTQLWNVLVGDMSLVGPRPNTLREVETYTEAERQLLSVRPGITDFSSIVFADEGEILRGHADPDDAYQKLIRPYKSRLSLVYVNNKSLMLNIRLVFLTVLAVVHRAAALRGVATLLAKNGASEDLVAVAYRTVPLSPGSILE